MRKKDRLPKGYPTQAERFQKQRRLDSHGNPAGRPARIEFGLTGSTARRDAQVRHGITRLIHYCRRRGTGTIAIEDLNVAPKAARHGDGKV